MKKLLALALVVLGLAACQTEPQFDVQMGGEQEVMLTVSLPEATRASSASDALTNGVLSTHNLRYIVEVYRVNEGTVLYENRQRFVETSKNTSMVFPVRLAPGYNYRIVAWTDIVVGDSKDDRCYKTTDGLDAVEIIESMWNPMDETRDAYTAVKVVNDFNSTSNLDMILTRPFAKLRVVATDITDIREVGLVPTTAIVEYSQAMPRQYNAVADIENKGITEEESEEVKTHEFSYPATPVYDDATGEYTLFADYIFVPSTGTAKFNLTVKDAKGTTINKEIGSFNTEIFVERNKLTTIKGDVLTIGGNIEVTVEEDFDEPGYELEAKWNGTAINEPTVDANDSNIYLIYKPSELAWVAAAVNGTLETRATAQDFAGKTFKLMNSIDLNGAEWTPIGKGSNHFKGSFDGNGKTIYGLTISTYQGQPQAALFGTVSGTATFKNFTIDGANIVMPADHNGDFYAAGLIATYYGNITVENVTVKNSVFAGNNKVAGLLAHDGVCSNLNISNTHILNCTISSTHLTDGGNVGGMLGLFQGAANGNYLIENSSVKNCTITGINATDSGKRANSQFVACVKSKENQTLVIEDCVVENNTFSQTTNGTTAVTYVGPFDNKFVGGEREDKAGETLPGVVIINGVRYDNAFPVASWDEFTAALAADKKNIKLTEDITYNTSYTITKDVSINLNGKVLEISDPVQMLNIGNSNNRNANVTIKNGTFNGKLYAQYGVATIEDVTFSGKVQKENSSTEASLQIKGANVYAKNCKISATHSGSTNQNSKTRPLSIEGRSSGTLKFENCEFKSNANQNQVYVNPLSGTATLDFTNCNFNNKTPNIIFAAACPLTNVTMNGTTKLSSVTFETNRAKDAITDADLAYMRELIANNSFSSVRVFYADYSSEYIR